MQLCVLLVVVMVGILVIVTAAGAGNATSSGTGGGISVFTCTCGAWNMILQSMLLHWCHQGTALTGGSKALSREK